MTVAELSPIQLYGIQLCALLTVGAVLLAWRAYPDLKRTRERALFWAGIGAGVGVPALIGLLALKP